MPRSIDRADAGRQVDYVQEIPGRRRGADDRDRLAHQHLTGERRHGAEPPVRVLARPHERGGPENGQGIPEVAARSRVHRLDSALRPTVGRPQTLGRSGHRATRRYEHHMGDAGDAGGKADIRRWDEVVRDLRLVVDAGTARVTGPSQVTDRVDSGRPEPHGEPVDVAQVVLYDRIDLSWVAPGTDHRHYPVSVCPELARKMPPDEPAGSADGDCRRAAVWSGQPSGRKRVVRCQRYDLPAARHTARSGRFSVGGRTEAARRGDDKRKRARSRRR